MICIANIIFPLCPSPDFITKGSETHGEAINIFIEFHIEKLEENLVVKGTQI